MTTIVWYVILIVKRPPTIYRLTTLLVLFDGRDYVRIHWDHSFRKKFFMEILAIMAWEIWKQQNFAIFGNDHPSLSSWKACFNDMLKFYLIRLSPDLNLLISSWFLVCNMDCIFLFFHYPFSFIFHSFIVYPFSVFVQSFTYLK